jgi:hypothetical protein
LNKRGSTLIYNSSGTFNADNTVSSGSGTSLRRTKPLSADGGSSLGADDKALFSRRRCSSLNFNIELRFCQHKYLYIVIIAIFSSKPFYFFTVWCIMKPASLNIQSEADLWVTKTRTILRKTPTQRRKRTKKKKK